MAQKKKGSNPIRITLTEDQISDIIQSAAKTRRGLRVENLEDRIAPSAIGAPMFDPSLPSADNPPIFDAANPPLPPLPGGDGLIGPPMPHFDPISGDPVLPGIPGGPPLPGDPVLPNPGAGPDATFAPPPVPDGIPGDPLHPITPPSPSDMSAPGNFRLEHRVDVYNQHTPLAPATGDPALPNNTPVDGPIDPNDYQQANHVIARDAQIAEAHGGALPTADEIDEHRRNILRQLRGA